MELFSATLIYKGLVVVLMGGFIPATAYTFLRVRLEKKDYQFHNTIRLLGISDAQAQRITPSVREEYSSRDYYLPTVFLSFLCLAGFTAFMFDTELLQVNSGKRELFLIGLQPQDLSVDKVNMLREQSFVAITMGFIGAFVWSAENIIRRLITGDLVPSTYYSASIRIVFSVLIALILVFLFRINPDENYFSEFIPVCAFMAGLMPEQALNYIKEQVRSLMRNTDEAADELALDMIEGMNLFHKARLSEISIDNAQNLAEANLIELLLKTPFNANQLIDWILQSKLYIYIKSDIQKLRGAGIRNALDILENCDSEDKIKALAQHCGVKPLTLQAIVTRLGADAGVHQLYIFHQRLSTLGDPDPFETGFSVPLETEGGQRPETVETPTPDEEPNLRAG